MWVAVDQVDSHALDGTRDSMGRMRLVFPDEPDILPDSGDPADVKRALTKAYPWPVAKRWVRANMVVTVDGRAQAGDGLTQGISSAQDKVVFAHLRADCDVVLVGAGTVRAEGYHALRPKPDLRDSRIAEGRHPAPCLAIVSASLDLDLDSDPFTAPHKESGVARPLILTIAAAPEDRRRRLEQVADVVVCGDAQFDPTIALDCLSARNLIRILCEGGPRLLTDMFTAGAIDELDLTISPLLLMHPSGGLLADIAGPSTTLNLAHVLHDQSTLMLRYLVEKSPIPTP
jgi:riboflavin biosynthesis pyrimidine reductase